MLSFSNNQALWDSSPRPGGQCGLGLGVHLTTAALCSPSASENLRRLPVLSLPILLFPIKSLLCSPLWFSLAVCQGTFTSRAQVEEKGYSVDTQGCSKPAGMWGMPLSPNNGTEPGFVARCRQSGLCSQVDCFYTWSSSMQVFQLQFIVNNKKWFDFFKC